MKLLLLASALLVATSATVLYGGNNYIYTSEDGSIGFLGYNGYKVFLNRIVGLKYIEITVSGPTIQPYTLQDVTSWDILYDILKQFRGPVDEVTYQKFLTRIEPYVQKGEITRTLYDLFVGLYKPVGQETTLPYYQSQYQYQYPLSSQYQYPLSSQYQYQYPSGIHQNPYYSQLLGKTPYFGSYPYSSFLGGQYQSPYYRQMQNYQQVPYQYQQYQYGSVVPPYYKSLFNTEIPYQKQAVY